MNHLNHKAMNDIITQWSPPSHVLFGRGACIQLPEKLKALGVKKPIVLTDKGVAHTKIMEDIKQLLIDSNIEFELFDDVIPEPPVSCLEAARAQAFEAGGVDSVIGVGGGSAMDVAKALSLVLKHNDKIHNYMGVNNVQQRGLPSILLPTTAGTGSEVTPIAILTDTETQLKIGIVSQLILPDISLVDPALTDSMPPQVTAATGMDALTHAIEAMISKKTNPYSQALALEAVRLISQSLRQAYQDGSDQHARDQMAAASTLAGMAFASSSCLAVHALAYPLGARYQVPHGQANAMLLAATMRFNAPACQREFSRLANAMQLKPSTPERFLQELEKLTQYLNIPTTMASVGVTKDIIPEMARDACSNKRLMVPNPRSVTISDSEDIYYSIL